MNNERDYQHYDNEFEPPQELYSSFNALRSMIGTAAYRSWFRGCEAWYGKDDAIHIKTSDAAKAKWIRDRYVETLENIAQHPVTVECVDRSASRHWPHNGPTSTQDAWWQTNERWNRDDSKELTHAHEGWGK